MKINYFFIILAAFFTQVGFSQLSVSAVATDEDCPGTGSLALSVQNANPSVAVNYKVYLLPEVNVPFWNSEDPNVPSLQDGEYHIVASQTIDGSTVTAETDATIGSNYTPLSFSINSINAVCGNDGSMVIEVLSGTPLTYELMSGPATAAPQSSNIFNGLPAGTYQVRVTDTCGNGYISTQTFYVDQPALTITGPAFSGALSSCNQIAAAFTVSYEGTALGIVYPLTVTYTVHPPSGADVVYNQVVPNGPANGLVITQNISNYAQEFSIDVVVTDPCGTTYTHNSGVINPAISVQGTIAPVLCSANTLVIAPSNYMAPYNFQFTSTPAGFNPSDTNSLHSSPCTVTELVFGNENNPVPLGTYAFQVTDACGRIATGSIMIEDPEIPEPVVNASNHDCIDFLGGAEVTVPNHPLATAQIVSGPASYSQPLPYNVTNMINEAGTLIVSGMPQGDYTITLTDICGNTFQDVLCVVPEYSLQLPEFSVRPDCAEGKGAIGIFRNLTEVTITGAPDGFEFNLPYNASSNIYNGIFAMNNLPAGDYTFNLSTICLANHIQTVTVPGLVITENEISLAGNCVNFDLNVNYVSNANANTTFWLQQYNDEADSWMNPEDGTLYTEGSTVNATNAFALQNQQLNSDLPYLGKFRVIKKQITFANGSDGATLKTCSDVVYTFEYFNTLDIEGIYNLTCVGEIIDIMVDAIGVSPLHFELISKNGDTSFYVDNADDNMFLGLEPAIYQVRVTDPCGGFRVEQFNVAELPPLVSAIQPNDVVRCDTDGSGVSTFDLSLQNDQIIGELDPDILIITHHATIEDATQGINALPTVITTGTAEIFTRVEWIVNPDCYGLATFKLVVAPPTPLVMADKWAYCIGQSVTVVADPGYQSYLWSNGATTQSIEVSEAGTYTVTVLSGTTTCEISKTIEVVPATPPVIRNVDVQDFNDKNNAVTVVMEQPELMDLYEFSIDGINWQSGNVFTNVATGEYNIVVRDRFNCNAYADKDIYLLDHPKFFTPNGDGVHDKWRIEYAHLEPGMMVYIYDRYGKALSEFGVTSEGWDGTFEGSALPATDYWFIVKRPDGREIRGHFAMMR